MFQKKEADVFYDIIIGAKSIIKGDVESEGSIRVDGKIYGDITSLGSVIISDNAYVKGNIKSQNADIYGVCEGNVSVRGKINIHENSTLTGDIVAKSFNTKEGSTFKGNCLVDPSEELIISLDPLLSSGSDSNLVDFHKNKETLERDKENNTRDTNKYTNQEKTPFDKKAK